MLIRRKKQSPILDIKNVECIYMSFTHAFSKSKFDSIPVFLNYHWNLLFPVVHGQSDVIAWCEKSRILHSLAQQFSRERNGALCFFFLHELF
jgi:hypothetical protein